MVFIGIVGGYRAMQGGTPRAKALIFSLIFALAPLAPF